MNRSIDKTVPNQFFYKQYVPIGKPSKIANAVSDTFFLTQFSTLDIYESYKISGKINNNFKEVAN